VKNQLKKTDTAAEIGKKIRKKRIAKGWTMMDLSFESEIDYRQIGRIERGETNFTIATLVKISSTLGVSMKDLVK
jgi:transcriptional regulator with XRE-family HTH domain